MRFLKYLIATITLIIAALLIIPFFISMDIYKDTIISQVKKHSGMDLKIDGNIGLSLFPMPEVTLNKVSLANIPKAKKSSFLKADKLSGKLDFMPLLKKRIVISNIAIANGSLKYNDAENNLQLQKLNLTISNAELFDVKSPVTSNQKGEGRWSKNKIDLSPLKSANAIIRLNIGKAISDDVNVSNIDMKSELKDGVLKVKSLSGNALEGKFVAEAKISSNSNQPISVKLDFKNAKIHNLVPPMNKFKLTNGILNILLNISSKGYSQYDYINNLDGNILLNGRDGRISGMDAQKIIEALNKPRNIENLARAFQKSFGKGETNFQNLDVNFAATKGIMNITKCELISNDKRVTAEGSVNLPNYSLDILAIINPGLKYLPSVKVHLFGPLDDMKHKIDERAIWKHLAKHALVHELKPEKVLKNIIKPSDSGQKNNPEDVAGKLIQNGLKNLFK